MNQDRPSPGFQWHSLKTRVTFFTLLIFLAGIWALAFYASRTLRQDMQDLLEKQQFSAASYMADGVNEELTFRLEVLHKFASVIGAHPAVAPASVQTRIAQHPVLLTLFNGGVFITGTDGVALASLPVSVRRVGMNFMDRDHIIGALKEGKAVVGRPVKGRALNSPTVAMTVPVRDAKNRIVGALVGVIDLDQPNFLDKLIHATPYSTNAGHLLIDARHRLVVNATDKRAILLGVPPPGANPQIDRFIAGYEGSVIFVNPRGQEVLATVKQIPVAGWYLNTQLPTQEVFAPIVAMQKRLFWSALVFTVLAGALVWWLSQYLLRRQLAPMLQATRTLADQAIDKAPPAPLPVTTHDEIGELIASFNLMFDTLAQRQSLLQKILDTASVAIFLLDRQGRITQASLRMAQMFGTRVEALIGRDYISLVHPDERAAGHEKVQAILTGDLEGSDLERLYRRDDGSDFWGHLTSRRITDAKGQGQGMVLVLADISERKSAEEQLRESELRYRGFLANMPAGIAITQNGTVRYVNHALQDMLGRSESELLNRPFSPLIAEADRARVAELHQRRMRGDAADSSFSLAMIHKDGELRQWQAYIKAIAWDGQPAGLGAYIDITERRQMEEQIRQLAFYDILTGLPNRRLLNDRLLQAMATSKRNGEHGAVLFLDLDNFKPLNDQHGHDAGDLLLMAAAARLKHCVREADTVARFGGDEFIIVLTELDSERAVATRQATAVAEKILTALAEPYRLTIRREDRESLTIEHSCTCSIGVTVFYDHGVDTGGIINAADAAMYEAKAAGRNVIRVRTQASPR